MNNLFSTVKSLVTTRQAAELYGLQVRRNGMVCCPFHGDKRPSMKVDERYYCFGCHETGDVIDFTAKLFGLRPLEAARKLAADFHIDPDTPAPAAAPSKWQREAEQREMEARCAGVLTALERQLKQKKEEYAPKPGDEDWDPRYRDTCDALMYVSGFLDQLYQPGAQEWKDMAAALVRSGAIDRVEMGLEQNTESKENETA